MTWKAHIFHDWASDTKKLWIRRVDHDGKAWFVAPLEMVEHGLHEQVDPAMDGYASDAGEFCAAIAEAAWEEGWRPASFKDHANELTATKSHLEDMRKISFAAVRSKFPMPGETE